MSAEAVLPDGGPRAAPPAGWGRACRLAAAGCAPVALVALLAWHWPAFDAGTDRVGHAQVSWLLLAVLASSCGWLATSCSLCGSTTAHLAFGRVFAAQVAGSFVGHLVPAGAGGVAVNVRMLRRCGLSGTAAAGAVAVNAGAAAMVHLIALAAVLALAPYSVPFGSVPVIGMVATILGAVVVLALLTRYAAGWLRRMTSRLGIVVRHGREVLARPDRVALLSVGATAAPALHVLTLVAVLHSMGHGTAVPAVALAYLGASAGAAVLPSPGGIGGLDVALLAALTAVGVTAADAVAAIIVYRLITVWMPLLPGAATFLVLLRRKII